jgi:glycosyltransferase involved in cell wall biosynthesis
MLRILHVLAGLDRAGAESFVLNVYRAIDREKVQFDFVVNNSKEEYAYEAEIRSLGGRIYHVPRYAIYNTLDYQKSWKQLLKQHPEWKIIHAHNTTPAFIYIKIASSMGRVTIAHSHIAGSDKSIKGLVKILFRFPLRYLSDYLFACSKSAAKWMFGESSSVQIIHNAIEAEQYAFNFTTRDRVRNSFRLKDKFVIANIGRMQPQKNQAFLLDVFHEIHQRVRDSVLMIIGEGELRPQLEKKIANLGLEKSVILMGERSDIPELLQAMDAFVFPSLYEGLGIAVIEAQTAGLPCIVSDAIPQEALLTDLVHVVPLSVSPAEWANQIMQYRGSFQRRNMTKQISAEGYDVHTVAQRLQNFYLKAAI